MGILPRQPDACGAKGETHSLGPGSFESEQFLERLTQDPILPLVTELRAELPYDLALQQYDQILADFSSRIAPELGWSRVG